MTDRSTTPPLRAVRVLAKCPICEKTGTVEYRRMALRELEQAVLLAPGVTIYRVTLGRTNFDAGFVHDILPARRVIYRDANAFRRVVRAPSRRRVVPSSPPDASIARRAC